MIRQKVETALNEQMKKEFYSAYLYLSMAAHFESLNFKGFANWMRIQSQEEYGHALKIFQHLTERSGKVVLQQIETPPSRWDSPKKVFEDAYQHEQKVTQSISDLVELSRAEKDHPTEIFLQWFVKEQVEDPPASITLPQKREPPLALTGSLPPISNELGKRTP